jgi:hypothetical protein
MFFSDRGISNAAIWVIKPENIISRGDEAARGHTNLRSKGVSGFTLSVSAPPRDDLFPPLTYEFRLQGN